MNKLWVDDLREAPAEWWWVRSSTAAIVFLKNCQVRDVTVDEMSLDHDLGGSDTTRPIVLWMCENEFWPAVVRCHSMNPVGRRWVEQMIERYKP